MMNRRAVPLLFVLIAAAGCGFFSRTKSRFFSLDRIVALETERRALTGPPVAIDAVELPPGADRREFVIRKSETQLDVRNTDQWSASFEDLFLHALAFDVADRLPEGMVILPGQPKPAGATRSLSVIVEELTVGPEPQVVLDARWILNGTAHPERITISIPSLESAEIAGGMSAAVAELASRITKGL